MWRSNSYSKVCPPAHLCGGTRAALLEPSDSEGLSPRLRGNLGQAKEWIEAGRSIPAPAGEPFSTGGHFGMDSVYPRACGGTPSSSGFGWRLSGLSPRLRGNPTGSPEARTEYRSIPAPAGEPYQSPGPVLRMPVYPRACGGTALQRIEVPVGDGLSPRLRGNLGVGHLEQSPSRSIPAPAGEPSGGIPANRWGWVYPRACGGTFRGYTSKSMGLGLSPRLRGNR